MEKCRSKKCRNKALPYKKGFCRKHYDVYCKARGPVGNLPVQPVVDHINWLRRHNMNACRIAELAGVNVKTVKVLKCQEYVRAVTAEKILSVQPDFDENYLVPALGTVRRLRALAALGYSNKFINLQLGRSERARHIRDLHYGDIRYVTAGMAKRVDEVYRRLHMTPAPDSRYTRQIRRKAALLSWAPPLAWDDIDDPDEQPHMPRPPAEWIDEYRKMQARGYTQHQIAYRMGITRSSLQKRLERINKAA